MPIESYSNIFVRYDLLTETPYYSIERSACENRKMQQVLECIVLGDLENITDLIISALEDNEPMEVIDQGLIKGMKIVSRLWEEGVYYLPQTLIASDTMLKGLFLCEKKLGRPYKKKGVAITHTAEGDIHDLGQKIVNALLRAYGFEVIDLGKDVPVQEVIAAVKKYKPNVLCGTAHLSTTMVAFKKIAEGLEQEGLTVPFLCGGGGGVTATFINTIKMAIYGKEALQAPKMAEDICKGLEWQAIRNKYDR